MSSLTRTAKKPRLYAAEHPMIYIMQSEMKALAEIKQNFEDRSHHLETAVAVIGRSTIEKDLVASG